jgi:Ca2+-binding EF-hand superfamily protein
VRRILAVFVAFSALVAAGFLWTRDRPVAVAQPPMPERVTAVAVDAPLPAPVKAPRAPITDEMREARRFNRYDKDKDERIDREEYLASRRKAFAKLDVNGDGRIDFEEYAAATVQKLKKADANRDGTLSRAEFATTAVKRKAKPVCKCDEE